MNADEITFANNYSETIFQDRQLRFAYHSPLRSQSQFCVQKSKSQYIPNVSNVARVRIMSKLEMLDSLNKLKNDPPMNSQKSNKTDILSKVAQLVKKLQHRELPHKMIEATVLSRKTSIPKNTKLLLQQEHIVKQITITQRTKGKQQNQSQCQQHHESYNVELLRRSPEQKDKKTEDNIEYKIVQQKLPQIKSQKGFSRSIKNIAPIQKNVIISYQTATNNSINQISNINNSSNQQQDTKPIIKVNNFNNVSNLLQTSTLISKQPNSSETEKKTAGIISQLQTMQQKHTEKRLPIPDSSNLSLSGWTDRSPIN
ncbi:unnamed protein product [Paramecium pentaurelia]|uniref:Uncharacterized protein n=1 Tax=Paramecium pentaurelia TaxID=43138 RepID=A0A8S1UEE3_9CILI|nr:unnamed protein product [Paramecium pentaurelia]